jgi:hypothetical protein
MQMNAERERREGITRRKCDRNIDVSVMRKTGKWKGKGTSRE